MAMVKGLTEVGFTILYQSKVKHQDLIEFTTTWGRMSSEVTENHPLGAREGSYLSPNFFFK